MCATPSQATGGEVQAPLIATDDAGYLLGLESMDTTHEEFIDLLNRLGNASGVEFQQLFNELHTHTERHFEQEYQSMQESGFPSLAEHHADHQRILGQLTHFRVRVEQGRSQMAKAYIREQLPPWFKTHLVTMDSALAAHLKTQS